MLWLYRTAMSLAGPFAERLLARRGTRGKEDPARIGERHGLASRPRPQGPLVWMHGASVGESLSILPLVDRLLARDPELHVLVTTGTVTSARLLEQRLPERAFHQFIPLDRPRWVHRFLDHWRPDAGIWIESELWPNLIRAAARRNMPMALVNARMSERSLRRWRLLSGTARRLLGSFRLCLAQSEGDAAAFRALGAPHVQVTGNLKWAAPPLPVDKAGLERLRAAIGGRPVWVAASTHAGEEEVVLAAHRHLLERFPDLLLILAPRHPERGMELMALIGREQLAAGERSQGRVPSEVEQVYLADTMGELGILYRVSDIVFIGGSLISHGGQNLLEPARLACAILHGPHMENFRELARLFASATHEVASASELADCVNRLLSDDTLRRRMAAEAAGIARGQAGVLPLTLVALDPILPIPGGDDAST